MDHAVTEPEEQLPGGGEGGGGEPEPEPGFLFAAGVVLYGVMGALALFWLWLRDRTDALPEQAIGTHGPFVASGVGLVVGVVGARLVHLVEARNDRVREMTSAAQRMFHKAPEGVGIAFVLVAATAEELFFRLAVQDAFGLVGSVAVYVMLHTSAGGLRWFVFLTVHALSLGLLVHLGFGLLGSTTAHAVLNYLHLRKVQVS